LAWRVPAADESGHVGFAELNQGCGALHGLGRRREQQAGRPEWLEVDHQALGRDSGALLVGGHDLDPIAPSPETRHYAESWLAAMSLAVLGICKSASDRGPARSYFSPIVPILSALEVDPSSADRVSLA
jgi:hypothetical protein